MVSSIASYGFKYSYYIANLIIMYAAEMEANEAIPRSWRITAQLE